MHICSTWVSFPLYGDEPKPFLAGQKNEKKKKQRKNRKEKKKEEKTKTEKLERTKTEKQKKKKDKIVLTFFRSIWRWKNGSNKNNSST